MTEESGQGQLPNCFAANALGIRPGTRPGTDPGTDRAADTSLRMLRTRCGNGCVSRGSWDARDARAPSAPLWDRYFSARARALAREQADDGRRIEAVRVRLRGRGTPAVIHGTHDTGWHTYVPRPAR